MTKKRVEIVDDEALIIEVDAMYEPTKHKWLLLWLTLWTLAGCGMVVQFFIPHDPQLNIYLFVWMGFWAYFEYKVVYAHRWRRWGQEKMTIKGEDMWVEKTFNGRGLPRIFKTNLVRRPEVLEDSDNPFVKAMAGSYWNIGKARIVFEYQGKDFVFGRELSDQDARKICQAMIRKIKKARD